MKKETERQQILALADNNGIAPVFPVNMEQVKARLRSGRRGRIRGGRT